MALLSDPLAAWAKEIVAMWILAMLPTLLALVTSRSATGVGESVVGRQWFGFTSTWMDLCCFSNSFLPLFCDGGCRWG